MLFYARISTLALLVITFRQYWLIIVGGKCNEMRA